MIFECKIKIVIIIVNKINFYIINDFHIILYELVDYDSNNLNRIELIIKNNSYIYKEDNKVISSPKEIKIKMT